MIQEFIDYVCSFYLPTDPEVLYPIQGLKRSHVQRATEDYLTLCLDESLTNITWGNGDSLDRERVRDILLNQYNFTSGW